MYWLAYQGLLENKHAPVDSPIAFSALMHGTVPKVCLAASTLLRVVLMLVGIWFVELVSSRVRFCFGYYVRQRSCLVKGMQ